MAMTKQRLKDNVTFSRSRRNQAPALRSADRFDRTPPGAPETICIQCDGAFGFGQGYVGTDVSICDSCSG
jgi:hypothetical protein